jgi:phage terminase small subunit
MRGLTPKQAAFVREYVVDCNGAQAAIRAGYAASRARVTAAELVAKRNVQDAIAKAQAEKTSAAGVTAEWIIERLKIEALAAKEGAARVKALELLGKRLRLWVDRVAHEGEATLHITTVVWDGDNPEDSTGNDAAAGIPAAP